jgi:hypothetical protein
MVPVVFEAACKREIDGSLGFNLDGGVETGTLHGVSEIKGFAFITGNVRKV